MSDKIKVSATVIPRLVYIEGKQTWLQVEVALNPHLPDSKKPPAGIQTDDHYPDDWGLGYYHEILHWYRYMEVFNRRLTFRFSTFDQGWNSQGSFPLDGIPIRNPAYGPDGVTIQVPQLQGPTDEQAAEELWKSMFTRETVVSGWSLDELPYEIAARLSTQELQNDIKQQLDTIIDLLLTPGSADQSPADAALALHLTWLRDSPYLIPQVFSDPVLSHSTDSRLQPYMEVIKKYNQQYSNELDQLHKELALHEQEGLNMDNTAEFHKKFSAYSAHAYLLNKTGWLWAYKIDITGKLDDFRDFPATGSSDNDSRVFISISNDDDSNYREPLALKVKGSAIPADLAKLDDPFYFNFLEEVRFLYPLTAIQVLLNNDRSICKVFVGSKPAADAPNDIFLRTDPIYGYVTRDTVDISATVIDRRQMMDKLDAQYRANQSASQVSQAQDGDQDAQSRDVSNAVRNEHDANAAGIAAGAGTEYTNNGITISIHQLPRVVSSGNNNTPANASSLPAAVNQNSDIEGTGVIYLHNMLAGFRVDVAGFNQLDGSAAADTRLSVASLCIKVEYYYTDAKFSKFCLQYPLECAQNPLECAQNPTLKETVYEGWIGISAQSGNGNKLFIDQEIGRWNNWSLVCMRLGDDHAYITRPTDDSTILTIQVVPPERSMVPQRFGWKYSFALRPADICGGGPVSVEKQQDCDNKDLRTHLLDYMCGAKAGVEAFWTSPIFFQRVDSIPGPAILRGTRLFDKDKLLPAVRRHSDKAGKKHKKPATSTDAAKKWIEGREGEDTNSLVIRSHYQAGALKIDKDYNTTIRYLGPPPATLDLVVQHGALDNLLYHDPSAPWSPTELKTVDEVVEEVFELADEKTEEYSFLYIDDNREIDYLYDPLAEGLELSIDNEVHHVPLPWGLFRNPTESGAGHFRYLKDRYWRDPADLRKNNQYFRIILADKPVAPEDHRQYLYHADSSKQGTIRLRQGCEFKLQVRCLAQSSYNQVDLFYPGVVRARTTQLTVIHAVEKPCLVDAAYNSGTRCEEYVSRATLHFQRSAGATDILLTIGFELFPVLTSESYFLSVQYIDLIGDKTAPLGYRLVKTEKLVKSNIGPTDPGNERNVVFANISHSFDTTIHRMANYRIEAISRFKKYFTPLPGDDQNDRFSVYGILRKKFVSMDVITDNTDLVQYNRFVKDSQWHTIPSTKRPDKPIVTEITPVIEWQEMGDPAVLATVERINRKVRIYLQDWHSTGANERVAILFRNDGGQYSSANTLIIHPDNTSVSLQGAMTQFGLDPIVNEAGPLLQVDTDFFEGLGAGDLIEDIPLRELQFPGAPQDIGDDTVCAALYDIQFFSIADLIKQQEAFGAAGEKPTAGKYYVDILINTKYIDSHYFPFLRFPVARFQPNSLLGTPGGDLMRGQSFLFRMSEIVLTDFVQLLPYRKVTVKGSKLFFATRPVARSGKKKAPNLVALLEETDPRLHGIYDTTDNLDTGNERLQIKALTDEEISFDFDGTSVHAINVMEYENYVPGDPGPPPPDPGDRAIKGDDKGDPRNDYHKRLVFAYTHQLK